MTLSFSQTWPSRMGNLAGQPNYFVQKIWNSILPTYNENKNMKYRTPDLPPEWFEVCSRGLIELKYYDAKKHTIRQDPHDRWKPGMKIHPVINNRTKNRFQFAPVMECVSVQYLAIRYFDNYPIVYIGDTENALMPFYWENPDDDEDGYGVEQMKQFAFNDGFESVEQFFAYFNEDFTGKIIHWTDFKY